LELFDSAIRKYAIFEDVETVAATPIKIQYHETLNPKVWNIGEDGSVELNPEVKAKLLDAGQKFFAFMKTPDTDVLDITITGSSANFNWTEQSDVDLHVVVNFSQAEKEYGELITDYYDAKKSVWNDLHKIEIHGMPVEFYVQNQAEKHYSTGIYSLSDDEWVIEPEHKEPSIDDASIRQKVGSLMNDIENILHSNQASAVEALMDKVKKMRKAGLEAGGEFSVENLVFKTLRNNGYLEKLADCKTQTFDRELSIEDEEMACWRQ